MTKEIMINTGEICDYCGYTGQARWKCGKCGNTTHQKKSAKECCKEVV